MATLREQTATLEAGLREVTERASGSVAERESLETRVEELRQLAARLIEQSAHDQAESAQAEEAAARHSTAEEQRMTALREMETENTALRRWCKTRMRLSSTPKRRHSNWARRCAGRKQVWWNCDAHMPRPARNWIVLGKRSPQSGPGDRQSIRF